MGNSGVNALAFLIETVFDLYILVVLLRFIIQAVRVDYYHPLAQFILRVTDPLLAPMRAVIPRLFGQDWAALIFAIVLTLLKFFILTFIGSGEPVSPLLLLPYAVIDVLRTLVYILMFSLVVQALLSWVNPDPRNPVVQLLNQITAPVLAPFRRFIPPVSGIDLSPLAAIISLQVVLILLS